MSRRYEQLDALRGLAALTVLGWHLLVAFSLLPWNELPAPWRWVLHSPAGALVGGETAVLFFFVLSGFVLALPFCRGPVSRSAFLAKRICRICVPYWAALAAAVVAREVFFSGDLPGLTMHINSHWHAPLRADWIVRRAFLVTTFDAYAYNGVVWSLVHEMRVSLIFPWLMAWVLRTDWRAALGFTFALSLCATWLVQPPYGFPHETLVGTVSYLYLFVLGMVLAKHKDALVEALRRLPTQQAVALLVAGVLAYAWRYWTLGVPGLGDRVGWFTAFIAGPGAGALILLSLARPRAVRALAWAPIRWLGRVSYSLYLWHVLVQLIAFHTLGHRSYALASVAFVPVSLVLAELSYRWLERPSITLGKRLAARWEPRPAGRVETPSNS